MIERGQVKVTRSTEHWFLRPIVTGYLHDFQTQQRTTSGYQNYADRADVNGGFDVGCNLGKGTWAVAGYRYGAQFQDQLFPTINPTYYDCTYHRVLFGLEGKPWNWVRFAVCAGPEFRHYSGNLPSTFQDVNEVYPFVDSSITFTPTKADTIIISVKNFEQPGFGGRSAYLDTTYDVTLRHQFSDKLTVGAGGRAYNTDFLKPVLRNDWIYGANALVAYAFNKQFSAELSYTYETARSEISNNPGREYTRNYVAFGLKYIFK